MSAIVGKNYGKRMLWTRSATVTLASGTEVTVKRRRVLVYVKTGSSRHRKDFVRFVKELGIQGKMNDKGYLIPLQSWEFNAVYEVCGTPHAIATLCSQNCILRHEDVFAGATPPRSFGKTSPFQPANVKLSERQHDSGKLMPTDKETGVVHGKVFRKPKGNAKAFRTVTHATMRREQQPDGSWKVTQKHEATYRAAR